MRIAFAGGGTGGHLYPAIAIADALRDRAEIVFFGSAEGLESSVVPDAGFRLEILMSRPLERRFSLDTVETAAASAIGIAQGMRALSTFRPDLVIATGGYVCFPAMAAARALRLLTGARARLVLLEPNAHPGLANRLLAPMVDEVWGAFSEPDKLFEGKYVYTGIPIRSSLLHPNNRIEAARRLGLDPSRRTILTVGGSQGARTINEAVAALVTRRALPAQWQILHISGERDYALMQAEERQPLGENRVVLLPYLHDMSDAYALSDLVIARAGASTLGELTALGIPSLLIPYPFASEDHQTVNAQTLAARGAAVVIDDGRLNADTLWWTLREMMQAEKLEAMRSAARTLARRDAISLILARVDNLVPKNQG